MSKATVDILFACHFIKQDNEQAIKLIVKKIYKKNIQIRKERKLLPFYYIDVLNAS